MSWFQNLLQFRSERALSFLLFFLVVQLFVVYPFFSLEGFGKYLIDVLFALVLISGSFAVEKRGLRRIAIVLASISVLTGWATYIQPGRALLLANSALASSFLAFAAFAILGRAFSSGPVTRHRVQGAVAVYLLIGLIFGSVFASIASTVPGAFDGAILPTEGGWSRQNYDHVIGMFSYFSFITLTTVGYGDITPVNEVAKQLTVLEGLIGQLYPAILLARLVSLQVSASDD